VPGAPLTRPEGQIAIGTVLQRFPETSLVVTPRSLQLVPGAIPVRTAEADARPLRREYLTLKLPPLTMQIPLAVQMCTTVPWRDPAY
jgi:hypothetical protein